MGSFVAGTEGNAAGFSLVSGGAYELGTAGVAGAANTQTSLAWADTSADDAQVVTISANDASGNAHPLSVTLGGCDADDHRRCVDCD